MSSNQDSQEPAAGPLSGQQVAALQKQLAGTVERILRDVELRKYALDQASKMTGTGNPVELAKLMHDFLTRSAVDAAKA